MRSGGSNADGTAVTCEVCDLVLRVRPTWDVPRATVLEFIERHTDCSGFGPLLLPYDTKLPNFRDVTPRPAPEAKRRPRRPRRIAAEATPVVSAVRP